MNLDEHSEIIEMCIQDCVNNVRNVSNIYVVIGSTSLPFEGIHVIDEGKLLYEYEGLSKRYIESRLDAEHSVEILADKYRQGCRLRIDYTRRKQ